MPDEKEPRTGPDDAPADDAAERERLLGGLLLRSAQPVVLLDAADHVRLCNTAFCALVGREPAEVARLSWTMDLAAPRHREQEVALLAEARRDGQPVTWEGECLCRDGALLPVSVLAQVEAGTPPLLCLFVTDLTRRRRVEERERQRARTMDQLWRVAADFAEPPRNKDIYVFVAERLRALVPDALVAVTSFDEATGFATVRSLQGRDEHLRALEDLLGGDLRGMLLPVPPRTREVLRSGKLAPATGGLAELLGHGVSEQACEELEARLGLTRFHSLGLARGGQLLGTAGLMYPRDREARDARLLESFAGQAAAAIQRRLVEEALKQSEQRFRLLAENATDVIWTLDQDLCFTFISPSCTRLLGYAPEELLGSQATRVLAPAAREQALAVYEQAWEEGERRTEPGPLLRLELEHRRKDDSPVWAELSMSFLRGDDGRVLGLYGASRDVTERRQAAEVLRRREDQLRESQKMEAIGALAGGIAHDFSNLLSVVLSSCEFLLGEVAEGNPLREDVEEIRRAATLGASLTRQLLAFSRRQTLQPTVVDLNEVLADLEKMLRRVIGEDIRLATSLPAGVWPVRVDRAQTEQMVMALVTNARDAMPRGGTLTLETCNVELDAEQAGAHADLAPGSYVQLEVRDTGTGMDAGTLARVFEPFFTTKGRGSGAGLGLATVYGIVKQSGGHVEVSSQPGAGSTFRVYLPRCEAPLPGRTVALAEARPASAEQTVLVVEDEDAVRALLVRALRRQGYRVLEAPSGAGALQVCGAHAGPIHVLLTDVVMPGMGGPELAERCRAARPGLRVLFMSGHGDDAVVRHGLQDTERSFLPKPFTPELLATKVREVLEG